MNDPFCADSYARAWDIVILSVPSLMLKRVASMVPSVPNLKHETSGTDDGVDRQKHEPLREIV